MNTPGFAALLLDGFDSAEFNLRLTANLAGRFTGGNAFGDALVQMKRSSESSWCSVSCLRKIHPTYQEDKVAMKKLAGEKVISAQPSAISREWGIVKGQSRIRGESATSAKIDDHHVRLEASGCTCAVPVHAAPCGGMGRAGPKARKR